MLSTRREYFPLIRLPSPYFDAITVLIGSCYSAVWKSPGLSCKILAHIIQIEELWKNIKVLLVVYAVPLIVYHTMYSMNSFQKVILELRFTNNCSFQRSDFSNVEVFLNYRKSCAYKYSVHKRDMP